MKVYSTNPATVSRRQWYMRNRERCNALRRELYRANPHKIRAQRAVGGNVLPRILAIACLLVCWSASAFAQFGSNTARRIFSGTAAPQETCNAGPVDVYVRTGGVSAGLYLCLSSNTWTGPLGTGSVTGTLATGGNPGPVPYVSAANTLSEDATNFCWDATNHLLGLGTCSPGAGHLIDLVFNSSSGRGIVVSNNGSGGSYIEVSGAGQSQGFMVVSPSSSCNSLGACTQIYTANSTPLELGTAATNQVFLQTTGELDIATPTAVGGSVKLGINGGVAASAYNTNSNCSAVGTAANPSVVSCGASVTGSFSCATNASTGTCQVNTTAVTSNSNIFIEGRNDTTTGTRLSVTCNIGISTALPEIAAVSNGASFTINLGTFTTNPECFSYFIVN